MSTRKRIQQTVQEIQRDEDLAAGDLLRSLGAVLTQALDSLLLNRTRLEVHQIHERLAAIMQESSRRCRELNDRRIARRGERHAAPEAIPEAVRGFSRNGAYLGAFSSLQAVAAHVLDLDALASSEVGRLDLTGVGLDLHLDGVVWTIEVDGELHVFRPLHHEPRESPPK